MIAAVAMIYLNGHAVRPYPAWNVRETTDLLN
jgi:hypothetical protein